jgi:hypothetical protein
MKAIEMPMFQVPPGRPVKWRSRIKKYGQGDTEADPGKKRAKFRFHAVPITGVHSHRQNHYLHTKHRGNTQSLQLGAPFVLD